MLLSLLFYLWLIFFLPFPWHCTRHPYPPAPFSSPTQLVLAGHGREVDGSSNERSTVPIKCLRFYSLVFPNTAMSQQSKREVRHFFFSFLSCFFSAMFASLEGLTLVRFSFFFSFDLSFSSFFVSVMPFFLFRIYNFISLSFHSIFFLTCFVLTLIHIPAYRFANLCLLLLPRHLPHIAAQFLSCLSFFYRVFIFMCLYAILYSLFCHHSVILSLQLQIFTRFCGSHSDIFLSASLSIMFKIHSHISFSCLKVFQFFFLNFIPSILFTFPSL